MCPDPAVTGIFLNTVPANVGATVPELLGVADIVTEAFPSPPNCGLSVVPKPKFVLPVDGATLLSKSSAK